MPKRFEGFEAVRAASSSWAGEQDSYDRCAQLQEGSWPLARG